MTVRNTLDYYDFHKFYSNIIYSSSESKYKIGISFFDKQKIKEERAGDVFYVIQSGEENRPDIISQKFYNTTNLDWLICVANDIKDPLSELIVGKKILIPSPGNIEDIISSLKDLVSE